MEVCIHIDYSICRCHAWNPHARCFCLEFSPCFEGLSFKKRNVNLESTVGTCTLNPTSIYPCFVKVPACQNGQTRFCGKNMLPRSMSPEDIKKEVAKSLDILTPINNRRPPGFPLSHESGIRQRFVVTNYKVGAPINL